MSVETFMEWFITIFTAVGFTAVFVALVIWGVKIFRKDK